MLSCSAPIAHNEDYAKKEGRSERINRVGLWASLALPFVAFVALRLIG